MKLIIFGTGQFAKIVREYIDRYDTLYQFAGFTTDPEYRDKNIINFDQIEKFYNPDSHDLYPAIIYGDMNRTRERVYLEAKKKGYKIATYVSHAAFVALSAKIGEGCFIFEDNTIQSLVTIEENTILWSGSHIGHSSIIKKNNFISSHVVISGNCIIEENCFVGVNATIGNGVTIGHHSWVSPGAIVTRDVPPHSLVKSIKSEVTPLNEEILFRALKK